MLCGHACIDICPNREIVHCGPSRPTVWLFLAGAGVRNESFGHSSLESARQGAVKDFAALGRGIDHSDAGTKQNMPDKHLH